MFAALAGPEDCTETGFSVPEADKTIPEADKPVSAADKPAFKEKQQNCCIFPDRNLFPGISAGVIGVLDYYGCVSLAMKDGFPSMTDRGQPGSMDTLFLSQLKEGEREGLEERTTAVTYITPELELPPFFIIHGTKDRMVNTRQSAELYERLLACGKEAEFYLLGGADHGGPEYWMKEVVDLADRFCSGILARSGQTE